MRIIMFYPLDHGVLSERLDDLAASLKAYGHDVVARNSKFLTHAGNGGYVEGCDAVVMLDSDPNVAAINTAYGAGGLNKSLVKIRAGKVSGLTRTAAGTGYNNPPTVVISGGGGSGATATVTVSAGGITTSFTVTNGGSGYTSAPTVSFIPNAADTTATGAAATATIDVAGLKMDTVDADTFTIANIHDGTMARWLCERSLTVHAADATAVLDPATGKTFD